MVDTFEGTTHVGLVCFQMNSVRPAFLPALPWLSYFNELNVRVYVRDGSGEPGVLFLSLDCDRLAAVRVAHSFFALPYYHAEMTFSQHKETNSLTCRRLALPSSVTTAGDDASTATYVWRPSGPAAPTCPGSLEFHLVERYTFFTVRRGTLVSGRVHHAPYQISPAAVEHWSAAPLLWDSFAVTGDQPPMYAHCSAGVRVEAFRVR